MKVKFFYLGDSAESLNDFVKDKYVNTIETYGDKIVIYYEEEEEYIDGQQE